MSGPSGTSERGRTTFGRGEATRPVPGPAEPDHRHGASIERTGTVPIVLAPRCSHRRCTERVVLTDRDIRFLRDVTRFGGLTVEWLSRRHFDATKTAYNRLERLQAVGVLALRRVFYRGSGVYVATRQGAELSRTGLAAVSPSQRTLCHLLHVADVALRLMREYPRSTWVTERELRREALNLARDRSTGRLLRGGEHVPDGLLVLPDGRRIAVEVERTTKWKRR